jgi:ABC-type uncharacterized transport system permease subunit
VLKATTGAHEVITTIMLNYLAFRLITYSIQKQSGWLPVDPQVQGTNRVLDGARLPILLERTRLHAGVLLALVAALVLWYVLFKTTFGYRLRTVGLSRGAASYGGIHWGVRSPSRWLSPGCSGVWLGLAKRWGFTGGTVARRRALGLRRSPWGSWGGTIRSGLSSPGSSLVSSARARRRCRANRT